MNSLITAILGLMARFGLSIFSGILITWTLDTYPTQLRSTGMSLCLTTGKLSTVFMPFLIAYCVGKINPMFFFGLFGFSGLLLMLLMPKISNYDLQDFLKEKQIELQTPFVPESGRNSEENGHSPREGPKKLSLKESGLKEEKLKKKSKKDQDDSIEIILETKELQSLAVNWGMRPFSESVSRPKNTQLN